MNRRTHILRHCVTVHRVRRGPYRTLLRTLFAGGILVGLYLALKIFLPGLAGLLDGIFAGFLERLFRDEDET